MATLQMGHGTLAVPLSLFRKNRTKVCQALSKLPAVQHNSYILLQGGKDVPFNDTDVNFVFRQESYFMYMLGVKEPDCYAAIHIETGITTLFVPRLPDEYATWMGRLLTPADFKRLYEVDNVLYVDELATFFKTQNPALLLTLKGINTDSGLSSQPATFAGIEQFPVNENMLHPVIAECRVIKSPEEIEVLRYVAKVSSDAHIRVMQFVKPGIYEYEAESLFLHHTYSVGGCRHVSYTCICGSGENGAILHYGHAGAPNDRRLHDGDMCLFDMGGNYCGYAADITCSFPANGKFTAEQRFIYNAVLAARNAVLEQARDGVSWLEMHKLSARVLLEQLKEGGLLLGDVEKMLEAGLSRIFQPHGLGHLIGLDVHDVGGYLEGQPARPQEDWLSKLRFARVLKAGMYVTVEPGCYFIESLLEKALADEKLRAFIDVNVLEKYRHFGGVRIEDDVLITKDGNENFAQVPRTVQEIEAVMAQGKKQTY